MKSSFYNVYFSHENKRVAYNSISDEFIIMEELLHDLFIASINENLLENLKNYHINFYESLIQKGFIIEDDIDELEHIKKVSYDTDFNDETYTLIINPTMNCNFKCWYCYETHIKDSKMSDETMNRIITFIENIIESKKSTLKNFELSWFGGEPLLYFKKTILPLSEKILDLTSKNGVNLSTGFTTNGLLIDDFFIVNAKKFNVSGLQITLDGHRERHNQVRFISKEKGSYDEILNKIKLCVFNDIYVTVRLNISEETLDNLNLICNDFLDINEFNKQFISFSFHEVWQNEKNLNSDISNIIDFYRENGFKCDHLLDSETALKNSCYADKFNQATINYNGDVFKCTARDFKSENREGILDSNGINWNEKFTKRIYETRFKNKPCLECKILPLCNGGCSQQRIENENMDYCIYNFDENLKIDVVKNKLKSRLYN